MSNEITIFRDFFCLFVCQFVCTLDGGDLRAFLAKGLNAVGKGVCWVFWGGKVAGAGHPTPHKNKRAQAPPSPFLIGYS